MTDKNEKTVLGWVSEALELRHGAAADPDGALKGARQETPDEIRNLLLRVRARADRVDYLLAQATMARGNAKRARDEAAFMADTAVMQATQKRAANRVEFSSSKEREADAKLDAFEARQAAYQRERFVGICVDACDVISQVHWQLDAMRKDLRSSLHSLTFESSLER